MIPAGASITLSASDAANAKFISTSTTAGTIKAVYTLSGRSNMAGLSDCLAQAVLNFMTGNSPMPALGSRYLALLTPAPAADSGSGASEVSSTSTAYTPVMHAPAFASVGERLGNQRQPRSPYSRIFFHDAVPARGLEPSTE